MKDEWKKDESIRAVNMISLDFRDIYPAVSPRAPILLRIPGQDRNKDLHPCLFDRD